MKDIEEIGRNIVHCAIKVHKALGPGLLESVYQIPAELECTIDEGRHKANGEQAEGVICPVYPAQRGRAC